MNGIRTRAEELLRAQHGEPRLAPHQLRLLFLFACGGPWACARPSSRSPRTCTRWVLPHPWDTRGQIVSSRRVRLSLQGMIVRVCRRTAATARQSARGPMRPLAMTAVAAVAAVAHGGRLGAARARARARARAPAGRPLRRRVRVYVEVLVLVLHVLVLVASAHP